MTHVENAEKYARQATGAAGGMNVERAQALAPTLALLAVAEAVLATAEAIDRLLIFIDEHPLATTAAAETAGIIPPGRPNGKEDVNARES